jgi:hypothetical protein
VTAARHAFWSLAFAVVLSALLWAFCWGLFVCGYAMGVLAGQQECGEGGDSK